VWHFGVVGRLVEGEALLDESLFLHVLHHSQNYQRE